MYVIPYFILDIQLVPEMIGKFSDKLNKGQVTLAKFSSIIEKKTARYYLFRKGFICRRHTMSKT